MSDNRCSFYGINLNQNVVLQQIHFDGSSGSPWTRLFKIATGNLIITALGFVPGYYFTVVLIEKLGRKWIQIQGFLLAALFRKHSPCCPVLPVLTRLSSGNSCGQVPHAKHCAFHRLFCLPPSAYTFSRFPSSPN